jgi:transposase-like protein/DDE family transposase
VSKRVSDELASVALGDVRLNARARTTVDALSVAPSAGAPQVLTDAELEGYYRFVNNDSVSLKALLKAHTEATVVRTRGRDRLVVAHDTTDFRFPEVVERQGLGPMDNGGQGFYAHFSLAVGADREAFGVVAVEPWTRAARVGTKQKQAARYIDPSKESLRWMRAVHEAERVFEGGPRLVHVMDREADDYDILSALTESGFGFVIRGSYDRRLVGDDARLKTFARQLDVRCERQAELSARGPRKTAKQRKLHPARDARTAELTFAAQTVTLRRPDGSDSELAALTLNVVHVYEPSPPAGCDPIEWFLLTTEPIESPEQIFQVVDDYRARWVIEEYFKALKTGCAYEKRQHETMDALLNALGIFIPIAWALLQLRTLSRDEESAKRPAEDVLTPTQLQILRMKSNGRLSALPTVGEAILLMARVFGGLQPSNGLPGWAILGRAFEKLLVMEVGWRLAMNLSAESSERSDR